MTLMKTALIVIALALFLSGCVASQEPAAPINETATSNYSVPNNDAQINNYTNAPNGNYTAEPAPPSSFPTITTSANPSNPDRGETFTLGVTAQDEVGIQTIYWESTNSFTTKPNANMFECDAQKTCTVNWTFTASEDGTKTITAYARSSTNLESARVPVEINVQPFDTRTATPSPRCGDNTCNAGEAFEICPSDCPYNGFRCANAVCEGGESYASCPQDCSVSNIIGSACGDGACEPGEDASYCPRDCSSIKPNCGNNICDSWETEATCSADCEGATTSEEACNSNQDCSYRQICSSGTCVDVDCTNDGQCGYGKECEGNRCVRCPRGPYGPAC